MSDPIFPATAMPDRDWWSALWPDPDAVLRALGVAPGMTMIDLCCGDGYFTAALARLLDGAVIAIDIDPEMIELTRTELDRAGVPVRRLLQADARELPALRLGKVDGVLIANTFHGVPDKPGLAHDVASILRPGGLFIIVNWHKRPRGETVVLEKPRGPQTEMRMSVEEVCDVVEPAGFVLDRTVELPPYHYGAVFRTQPATGTV